MRMHTTVSQLILLASIVVYGQDSGINTKMRVMTPLQERPRILQGPVVVATGANWAVIEWTTNAAGRKSSIVYAGTHKADLHSVEQSAEPVRISDVPSYMEQQYTHLVRLNHLQPGTTYYFQVDSGPEYETGRSSVSKLATTKRPGLTNWGTSIQ